MQLIAPDILVDTRDMALEITALAIGGGLLLWLNGWRWHRFWLVLLATVTAGLLGLKQGVNFGTPPLVAAAVLALTAGALVVALLRGLAFAAGAVTAWLAMQALMPTWEQPLLCLLGGGLLGLLLFRFWIMALTSFAASVLLLYCSLSVADRPMQCCDAVVLAGQQTNLLNATVGLLTGFGILAQTLLDRRRARKIKERKQREEEARKENERKQYEEELLRKEKDRKKKGWLSFGSSKRRAG
jgi:hypothetical protein